SGGALRRDTVLCVWDAVPVPSPCNSRMELSSVDDPRRVSENPRRPRGLPCKRLLDGEEIAPDEAFLDWVAQEIGGVEGRDGPDLAGAGVIGVPAAARPADAFLDAEQRLCRRTAEADQDVGVGELDLAQREGQAGLGF